MAGGAPSPILVYPQLSSDPYQHTHFPHHPSTALSLHAAFAAHSMQAHSPPSPVQPKGQTKRKGSSPPHALTPEASNGNGRAGERKHLRNEQSAAAAVVRTAQTASQSRSLQLLIPPAVVSVDECEADAVPMMISPRSAQNLVPAFNLLPVAAPSSPTQPASAPPLPSLHFPLDSLPRPLVSSASADLLSLPFSSGSSSAFHTLTPRKPVLPTFAPLASASSPPLFMRPPMPPVAAPLAMPDAKAFEREASIEKKRRSKRKSALATNSALTAASPPRHNGAPITPAINHASGNRFAVPIARERPHPPSTPMKTPASVRDAGVSIIFRSPYVTGKTPAVVAPVYVPPSPLSSRASQHIRTLPCTPSRPLFQPIVDELVPDTSDATALTQTSSSNDTAPVSVSVEASPSASPSNSAFTASFTSPSSTSAAFPSASSSYFSSNFTLLSELGRGDFGIVYLCRWHADNALYAVKKSLKPLRTAAERHRACREINHFVSLTSPTHATSSSSPTASTAASATASTHPNLLCYYQAWMEESHLYIQTEYLAAGTLRDAIDRADEAISEDRIWDWAAQILSGLAFLHSRAILHLDVKPDNVFMTRDGTLKIGDLGTSVREGGGEGREEVEEGDAVYIAPELLDGGIGVVSAKADIFSLGLTLFEIAADVILPTRGEAWNDLRMEKVDWNGSSYFLSDSPVSLCSPEMRHLVGGGSVNGAGRRSPLTCISPIVMEKGVYTMEEKESAATADNAQHRRSFTPVNSLVSTSVADGSSDVFLSPMLASNHPPARSGSSMDEDEDGVRTPIVRPHMRTRSTPISARPSPSLTPSAYDSPATVARPLSFAPTAPHSACSRPASVPRSSSPFSSLPSDDGVSVPTLKRRRSSVVSAGAGATRSQRLRSVISGMLKRDPALRPSVTDLLSQPNIEYALERRRQAGSLVRVEEAGAEAGPAASSTSERAPRQLFTNKAAVL